MNEIHLNWIFFLVTSEEVLDFLSLDSFTFSSLLSSVFVFFVETAPLSLQIVEKKIYDYGASKIYFVQVCWHQLIIFICMYKELPLDPLKKPWFYHFDNTLQFQVKLIFLQWQLLSFTYKQAGTNHPNGIL